MKKKFEDYKKIKLSKCWNKSFHILNDKKQDIDTVSNNMAYFFEFGNKENFTCDEIMCFFHDG